MGQRWKPWGKEKRHPHEGWKGNQLGMESSGVEHGVTDMREIFKADHGPYYQMC